MIRSSDAETVFPDDFFPKRIMVPGQAQNTGLNTACIHYENKKSHPESSADSETILKTHKKYLF
jgi:hypothetical protein